MFLYNLMSFQNKIPEKNYFTLRRMLSNVSKPAPVY